MLWDEEDDEFFEDRWDAALGFDVPTRGKPPMSRYVVCYDIIDNRRRTKVAECLEGWGARVQYSVFEVVLETRQMRHMTRQLAELINPKDDRISIYPVCAACDSRRVDLGDAVPKPMHEPFLIL